MHVGSRLKILKIHEDVQSLDAAAVVPDDAISVCIANRIGMSHTSAFEGSMYIDDTCGVCSEVFEYQHVQTVQETEVVSDDATSVCTSSKSVMSDEGGGHL